MPRICFLLLYNVKHLHAATPKCMPNFVHQLPPGPRNRISHSTRPAYLSSLATFLFPPRATFCICIYVRRQFKLPRLQPAPDCSRAHANRTENISHFHGSGVELVATWPPTHLRSVSCCERSPKVGLKRCSQFASLNEDGRPLLAGRCSGKQIHILLKN